LTNENILKLIFTNIAMLRTKQLQNKINNKEINLVILRLLDYNRIVKSYGKSITTFSEHKSPVNSIAQLSEDIIVSASSDKTLKVWDLNTYLCIKTLEEEYPIRSVLILPNGNIAATVSIMLKIFDTENDFKLVQTKCFEQSSELEFLLLLSNGYLACTCKTVTYIILILDPNDNFACIEVINDHSFWIFSLINLPKNKFASGRR
jgi:WD40 repeat protein